MNRLHSPNGRALRLVIGSITLDTTLGVSRLPVPGKQQVLSRDESVGGGGANVAIGCRLMAPEASVALMANVGRDRTGQQVRETLEEWSVELPLSPIAGRTSTSTILVPPGGDSAILTDFGVRTEPMPMDRLDEWMAQAAVCCLASPTCQAQIPEILACARRHQVPVSFGIGSSQRSVGGEELAWLLSPRVEMLICNADEAEHFTGANRIADELRALSQMAQLAVITRGAAGITAHDGQRRYDVPAYRDHDPVLDSTGCGDAAHAALIDAQLRGHELPVALAAAARQGYAAATALGATAGILNAEAMGRYLAALELAKAG